VTSVAEKQESGTQLVRLTRLPSGAARLTLTRSERRNAVNRPMADQLSAAVAQIGQWGIQVGIIDAEGPAFCAGADLGDLVESGTALDDVLATLTAVPVYWTAMVDGAVRGGGLSILAVCPYVIATSVSTFGLPEISRGFFPADVIDGQVPIIGARRAFDLAFRGRPVDAAQALAMGIVSEVVIAADELETRAEETAVELLAVDPGALRQGVELWQARASTLRPTTA